MSSSSGSRSNETGLSVLYTKKIQKLQEQKNFSDQMHMLLTKKGGLNENNKQAQRNLNMAIAVSKKPGYFHYHAAADDIQEIEHNKVLATLARSIAKCNGEIDQINEEIIHASSKPIEKMSEVSLMSIGQWHETYGKASRASVEGMITQFDKSTKIYGGTAHHRSFKTVSSVMKKGRITR
mmetsp:Transcript_5370/g.5503  ORF Transcript_5370/g.5503 Transcript_5370/m.5503 type:complete len:180 (+) Transcript_5370:126-665(+)